MDARSQFEIWAPPESIWSQWVKPVIFTVSTKSFKPETTWFEHDSSIKGPYSQDSGLVKNLPDGEPVKAQTTEVDQTAEFNQDVSFWAPYSRDSALIVNLPGVQSVKLGVSLTGAGFRPIPLFNSINGPGGILDNSHIAHAIEKGSDIVARAHLYPDSPPAFLLDSARLQGSAGPGSFDNRWVVFPQDFPSGVFLQSRGIRRITVIQNKPSFDRDLAQVLRMWQKTGLEIFRADDKLSSTEPVAKFAPVSRFDLARPLFAAMLISSLGLHRRNIGGFGSFIPDSSRYG